MNERALAGTILGTAVGDALGLPYEGLSRLRGQRMLGEPDRHRFVFGRGMVSDDTEHTCLIGQSLIAAGNDELEFARQFARRLRYWLLGVPAGIGFATLRATIKLWLGAKPDRSGVFSAGNGPAMRSALLGVALDDLTQLQSFVRASTRITHTDPLAEYGALAVALAAHVSCRRQDVSGVDYLNYPGATDRYAVIYALTNTTSGERVIVKTMLNDPDPQVASVYPLWKAADWMERECYDMFGVHFIGHPDPRRILLPDEFVSYPLRKDYPLRGRGERHNFPTVTRAES